jgi:4-hydroxythreonine-4-phosphate dehydrogenase
MTLPIAIIAGEPNSISSEIIFKSWLLIKKFTHKPILVIGNIELLNIQKNKMKFKISIKEVNKNFKNADLYGNKLPVYNVNYKQKKVFQKISTKSNDYIFKSFDVAMKLIKRKKIQGFINCPIHKETLLKKKYKGITEFLSKKYGSKNNEVMLIYNKKLAVSPLTTHIPLRKVSSEIKKSEIVNKIQVINNFYRKIIKKKPKIAILGLNPHNYSATKYSEEEEIIIPAIKIIKNKGINITGPIATDASFAIYKKHKFNVIFGMYHDQVLTPFKALFKYDAINITLGLPFIRISPDHGVGENIVGKRIANPQSLVESIKFFNIIKD